MTKGFRFALWNLVFGAVLMLLALLASGGALVAQGAEPTPTVATEPAPQAERVRALIELLGDPQVRDWLREQLAGLSQPGVGQPARAGMGAMKMAERRLEAMRAQLRPLAATVPRLPAALATAWARLERAPEPSS